MNALNLRLHLLPLTLLFLSTAPRAETPDAETPNIVMIISDDQTWTDYGFMGHPEIQTPNLDRLASESALFTRGYVPCSLCRCSLATLVTGLYAHQHAITSNDPPEGVDRHELLRHIRGHPTLPQLLAEKGYLSFQSGKWWEGDYELGGFTHGMTHGDPARGGRHGDEGLKIGREGLQPIFDFIEQCGERPFFLWYAPFLPHRPHNPPERLLRKYAKPGVPEFTAKYQAMCEWFDETCGELLDYLDGNGLSEETLVLFVADNGWIQLPDRAGYAPRSKRSPYDGGLRTPIMLRQPGRIEPMRDDETLVLSLDFAPTILRAAGLEPTDEMPGIDLLDIIEGRTPRREIIFGEVFMHDAVDIAHPETSLLYRWCIAGDWKLILPRAGDETPELFNLADDPFEELNRAAGESNRVEGMKRLIDAWWRVD